MQTLIGFKLQEAPFGREPRSGTHELQPASACEPSQDPETSLSHASHVSKPHKLLLKAGALRSA